MTLLWIHALMSLIMMTIIILVQRLIYPQFQNVPTPQLPNYAKFHNKRISQIVIPVMLIEAGSLLILWTSPKMQSLWLLTATLTLALIWGLTFFKIVPIHQKISTQPAAPLIPKLLGFNRYRTGLWILKTTLIVAFLAIQITPKLIQSTLNTITIDQAFSKPNGHQIELPQKNTTLQSVLDALAYLQTEPLSQTPTQARLIVRTPYLKFPDLLIINIQDHLLKVRSQSLIGYSDLGTNKHRLEQIKQKIAQIK